MLLPILPAPKRTLLFPTAPADALEVPLSDLAAHSTRVRGTPRRCPTLVPADALQRRRNEKNRANPRQRLPAITGAVRIRLWLVAGWGCRGRRPSKDRGNRDTRCVLWRLLDRD